MVANNGPYEQEFDIYKCVDCKDIDLTCELKVPCQEDRSRPFQCPYWINEKPPWRKQRVPHMRVKS